MMYEYAPEMVLGAFEYRLVHVIGNKVHGVLLRSAYRTAPGRGAARR